MAAEIRTGKFPVITVRIIIYLKINFWYYFASNNISTATCNISSNSSSSSHDSSRNSIHVRIIFIVILTLLLFLMIIIIIQLGTPRGDVKRSILCSSSSHIWLNLGSTFPNRHHRCLQTSEQTETFSTSIDVESVRYVTCWIFEFLDISVSVSCTSTEVSSPGEYLTWWWEALPLLHPYFWISAMQVSQNFPLHFFRLLQGFFY
jgi:hypothetical protein